MEKIKIGAKKQEYEITATFDYGEGQIKVFYPPSFKEEGEEISKLEQLKQLIQDFMIERINNNETTAEISIPASIILKDVLPLTTNLDMSDLDELQIQEYSTNTPIWLQEVIVEITKIINKVQNLEYAKQLNELEAMNNSLLYLTRQMEQLNYTDAEINSIDKNKWEDTINKLEKTLTKVGDKEGLAKLQIAKDKMNDTSQEEVVLSPEEIELKQLEDEENKRKEKMAKLQAIVDANKNKK